MAAVTSNKWRRTSVNHEPAPSRVVPFTNMSHQGGTQVRGDMAGQCPTILLNSTTKRREKQQRQQQPSARICSSSHRRVGRNVNFGLLLMVLSFLLSVATSSSFLQPILLGLVPYRQNHLHHHPGGGPCGRTRSSTFSALLTTSANCALASSRSQEDQDNYDEENALVFGDAAVDDDDDDNMLVGPPLLDNNNNNNNNNTVDDDYLSRRWVLLVDDEEPIRQAVGQLLTNQGYHVTAYADGWAALQALPQPKNASGRLPDVIVSDVRLPGDSLDGLGLLRAVRASVAWRSVPVVLLTARGAPLDRVAGYQAGADAYLPKPFDPDELIALLERVVQRREQLSGSIPSGTSSTSTTSSTSNSSRPGSSSTTSSAIVDDMKRSVQEIQRLLLLDQQGGNNNINGYGASAVFLAPPERQVLQLLCQGLRNKEIAERTFLSTRRVEQVLTTLYRKTNVKNRTELVRWAIATGHVQL